MDACIGSCHCAPACHIHLLVCEGESGAGEEPGRPQQACVLLLPLPHSLAQEQQSQRALLRRVDIVQGRWPRSQVITHGGMRAPSHSHRPPHPAACIPTPTALCSSQASFLPPASASSPCLPFSLPGTVQPSLRTTYQNSLSNLNSPTGVGKAGEAKTLQIKFKQFFSLVDRPCQPRSLLFGSGQQLRDPSQRLPGWVQMVLNQLNQGCEGHVAKPQECV